MIVLNKKSNTIRMFYHGHFLLGQFKYDFGKPSLINLHLLMFYSWYSPRLRNRRSI